MAHPEVTMEREAYEADTETENMLLRDNLKRAESKLAEIEKENKDLKRLYKEERLYARDQRDRQESWRRMISGEKSATDALELVRNILDETDCEDDDENMKELRKMTWNSSDEDKRFESENADLFAEATTAAWNE